MTSSVILQRVRGLLLCLHVQTFTVESKKAATFTVDFHPPEIGMYSHELQLRVKQNPFEQYRVAITGEQPISVWV